MPRAVVAGVYAYPVFVSQTEKGIRNISIAMVIFLVVQVLLIGLLAALFPLIASVTVGGLTGDPNLITALFAFVALVCVLALVYVIGLIFGLIGLLALHKGRDEFGPAHAQKIDRGIVVLILGIFIPIVVGSIGSSGALGSGAVGLSPNLTLVSAGASLASGVLGSLLVGLFLMWSVEALATPVLRMRAMIALVLGIGSGAAGGAASLVVLSVVPIPTNPSQLGNFYLFLIPGMISAGISVASLALWFLTYRGVLDRFKRGELRAAPPMVYPPAYMPPYPQYATPYPPPVPPPQAPPPAQPPP